MAYEKIQFIAYALNTAPTRTGSAKYLGLDDAKKDIEARCELILRAAETAASKADSKADPEADPKAGSSDKTLKVFMLPEFYFRGKKGAYEMDDVQTAIERLQKMVEKEKWKDWLFAFGTIVGRSSGPTSSEVETYNFSLLQKGGGDENNRDARARVVMKENKSDIDFISSSDPSIGISDKDAVYLTAFGPSGAGKERQRVNYDGGGIFELDGITWGVDICLDHGAGRLQASPQLPGENRAQVQLIPSCGMEIGPNQVIAGDGGYIFNCDGSYNLPSGSNGWHSALKQAGTGTPPTLTDITLRTVDGVDGSAIALDTLPAENISVDSLFPLGPGEVHVYEEQAIPSQVKIEGSTRTVKWNAHKNHAFIFDLSYDKSNSFVTARCNVISANSEKAFENFFYVLPLNLRIAYDETKTPHSTLNFSGFLPGSRMSHIGMKVEKASRPDGFNHYLYCDIDLPGYSFRGTAFRFKLNGDAIECDPPQEEK